MRYIREYSFTLYFMKEKSYFDRLKENKNAFDGSSFKEADFFNSAGKDKGWRFKGWLKGKYRKIISGKRRTPYGGE